ncbi:MAG: preprotein translocase subunit YajC [Bacteroidetes bacterium]|nr:preprotein translocase subunit YajC [Bacteroidota bacterium]MBS1632297.1 preprotein translocase subunit YajC [Bacteroidota bacterium]
MKAIYSYLVTFAVAISFTACVPPGGTGTSGSGQSGSAPGFGGFQFIFLGLMILVFWMFFIRPQAKKAKNQKNFIQNLQKGDKIVTIAGIHGTINKLNEDTTINLEVSPGSYIKIEKSAISMEWTAALNKAATATTDKK